MRVNDGASRRTITNQARRKQIVETTIEVIAEEGYQAATFQRIAQRAGLASTRSISYHFDGKDDLIDAVVADLLATVGGFVSERVSEHGQDEGRDPLADYIRTVVALNDNHRTQMRALTRVFLDHRPSGGDRPYTSRDENTAVSRLQGILTEGQRTGRFRDFDAWIMAVTVQRSLDGIPFLLEQAPDLDLDRYAEELVTAFDLATRRQR